MTIKQGFLAGLGASITLVAVATSASYYTYDRMINRFDLEREACAQFAVEEGWRSYNQGKQEVIHSLEKMIIAQDYTREVFERTGLHEDDLIIGAILKNETEVY